VNKAQLIEALSERLGDKKAAGAAVDGLVDVIVRTVNKGEKVNITGFGVFEKRARAARTARNPRTGETVKVKKTTVPAFRAGTTFKDVVSGAKKLPKVAATRPSSRGTAATAPRARRRRPAPRPGRAAATRTRRPVPRPTRSAAPPREPVRRRPSRPPPRRATTSRAAAAKSSAAKPAPKAAAKATTAKKTTAAKASRPAAKKTTKK
jgi:DNA-binding protein HU-beta